MRRAVITASATAAGVVLLLSLKPHDPAATHAISSANTNANANSGTGGGGSSGSGATDAAQGADASARTVTGSAVNTRYGPVQVKVTVTGGKISRIDVVQYPTRDRRDREINEYAVPVLNQEAIAAQSADIDVVSGATYTSDGYTRSLQSALDQLGK
ncbi:FMN-binding protein [Kitasatospora phosalacinea]|uniref:FMN-binding protein n=1 Tax=Kitasatospora phosalacinea TaxID=2065 RepID=A0A9W6Q674_9ACTN|nr:FMN-binding protein [Kitasatospora phosalacinea]GLW69521.1 FMN-binding protein [Kitasatospora phosalacinea]